MRWPFLDTDIPFGFAHQGGTDAAPGNTLAAFEHATSLGYRYIETDIRATNDGVLVLFHDDILEPLTGAGGRIEDLSWTEVAELRIDGSHPIPRFDETVERFPDARFNLDAKDDSVVEPLIEAIDDDLVDRVLVGAFSQSRVRRFQEALGPRLATSPGPLGLVVVLLRALLWPRGDLPYAAVQIPTSYWRIPLAPKFLIGRYHRLGLQVHLWTINDVDEMTELLDRGADAIISDRTEDLRRVLDGRS